VLVSIDWKKQMQLKSLPLVLVCAMSVATAAETKRAKNVILFLADAGGISTLNAASIVAYGAPQKLAIQSWPAMGLSDTSTASQWVSDSAAGMTAIVTGQKTHNGVISQGPDTVRGKQDGTPLKTILEHAEERGLSTGVVSNVNIADATPAACYAQANDRKKTAGIFLQIFSPRFGDGVDVVLGQGRKKIYADIEAEGKDLDEIASAKGRKIYSDLSDVPEEGQRAIAVLDDPIDLSAAARIALDKLSQNPKGFFLMIESDSHTNNLQAGINRVIKMDKLIREVMEAVDPEETLLLFTADHSFDLSIQGGIHAEPLLKGLDESTLPATKEKPILLPYIRVGNAHTGEEVVVAAKGPGSDMARGYMPNTRLFEIMMSAFGWTELKHAQR
jgi:alkaline phosphatase